MDEWDVPEYLLRLAARAARPGLQPEGLLKRFGAADQVKIDVGQVWRARWDTAVVLVLILAVRAREVSAVPVTLDPPAENTSCLVVDGVRSVFGVEATIWGDLPQTVPVRVLDQVLDTWENDIVGWAKSRAQGQLKDPPAATRLGREPSSVFEDAAALRAELEDDLTELCEAPRLVSDEEIKPGKASLAALLGDRLDLAQLTAALGRPQSQVMAILRGKEVLEPGDIAGIAKATGLPQEQVAASVRPLPRSLVEAVEHPRWRPALRRLAQGDATDELQARLLAGYGAFALAARETGGRSPDWDARLQQFLVGRGEVR